MIVVVLLLLILPFAAALVSLRAPDGVAEAVSAVTGVACFGLVLALVPAAAHHDLVYLSYLRIDAVSAVFLLATSFLYGAVAVYSIGYLAPSRRKREPGFSRYSRRFYAGLNLFAWTMLAAPMMNNLALLWIAVEVTTVISALLVAIENTDGAAEAAWKYILIASAGLGLALLATIFAYYAGAQVLGEHYDLSFTPLLQRGPRLPHTPVRLAFVLAVLGFGTKMGLVPVHTWLPDAHSEAPTPVSALLSGSLLAVSFYAILRYYQVAAAALGPRFPRDVLLVFGVASLLLAALYLLDQRDVKRMLAYSSVEHMGILAIGVSFGAPIALAGVLLHVLAHAAAKGNAFMGAGVLVHKFGSKRISGITGGLDLLPWSGPLFGARDPRAVRDAAVRHIPQRVRDRGRWLRRLVRHRRRHPDRAGDGGVLRPDRRHQPDAAHAPPGRDDRRRRRRYSPGASPARGWWCPWSPGLPRCSCSACTRLPS